MTDVLAGLGSVKLKSASARDFGSETVEKAGATDPAAMIAEAIRRKFAHRSYLGTSLATFAAHSSVSLKTY